MAFRFDFDLMCVSLRVHFDCTPTRVDVTSMSLRLTSTSLRLHFGPISTSLGSHSDVTSTSLRFRFQLTAIPFSVSLHNVRSLSYWIQWWGLRRKHAQRTPWLTLPALTVSARQQLITKTAIRRSREKRTGQAFTDNTHH